MKVSDLEQHVQMSEASLSRAEALAASKVRPMCAARTTGATCGWCGVR
jgi:hypothetical protein